MFKIRIFLCIFGVINFFSSTPTGTLACDVCNIFRPYKTFDFFMDNSNKIEKLGYSKVQCAVACQLLLNEKKDCVGFTSFKDKTCRLYGNIVTPFTKWEPPRSDRISSKLGLPDIMYLTIGKRERFKCPEEYNTIPAFGQSRYRFGDAISWSDAATSCNKEETKLVHISSLEEMKHLWAAMNASGQYSQVYVGARKSGTGGAGWIWEGSDGQERVNQGLWAYNEPKGDYRKNNVAVLIIDQKLGAVYQEPDRAGSFMCECVAAFE